MLSATHLRAVAGIGVAVLTVAVIAATRPPGAISGQPTVDRARVAEVTFPFPHLLVLRLTEAGQPDEARVILDDGSIAAPTQIVYQVPTDSRPFQVAATDPYNGPPACDDDGRICWGPTTVTPTLDTTIKLTYLGLPCTLSGSQGARTAIQCTDPSAG